MGLIDKIPIGKENAVSRAYLVTVSGMSDRKIRNEIERITKSGEAVVCNLSDGKGYYIAKDYQEILEYKRQEKSRMYSGIEKIKAIDKYIEVNYPMEGQLQMEDLA